MNQVSPEDLKRSVKRDAWLAAILFSVGLATIGLSLVELRAQNQPHLAQATGRPGQPLQATPAPSASSSAPAEWKPGGPTTPAPEPARPNAEAQKEGAKPALPPAPAEKMAPPIKDKK